MNTWHRNVQLFSTTFVTSRKIILQLNFNIRLIGANFDTFNCFTNLLNKKIDILSFSESWLNDNNKILYTNPARGRVGWVTDCGVRGVGFKSQGSILTSTTDSLSCTSSQGWLEPMLCTGKWVKKMASCGGVFDLAVEQPQLFRKLPKNKTKKKLQDMMLFTMSNNTVAEVKVYLYIFQMFSNPK